MTVTQSHIGHTFVMSHVIVIVTTCDEVDT